MDSGRSTRTSSVVSVESHSFGCFGSRITRMARTVTTRLENLPLPCIGSLISLSCTLSAVAADVAGYTSGTQKVLSSIALQTAVRLQYLVGVVSDARAGLFHGATQQCLATVIQDADGATIQGHGSCDCHESAATDRLPTFAGPLISTRFRVCYRPYAVIDRFFLSQISGLTGATSAGGRKRGNRQS